MVRKKSEIPRSLVKCQRSPRQRINCSQFNGWFFGAVLIISSLLVGISAQVSEQEQNSSGDDHLPELKSIEHNIEEQCIQNCAEQYNQTHFGHLESSTCGTTDCYVNQCFLGCRLWEQALESTCESVCNKTDLELLEPKVLYCVRGCNDGLSRYFKWIRAEVGTPSAPALVADSLTATSLALEWENPEAFMRLSRGRVDPLESYLVQFRFEENVGDWKFCSNQSIGHNSTIVVDNLNPYTKYRFRVALQLSRQREEYLTSEESVVISTLEQGVPMSTPRIVSAIAVDHSRISVTWEPGPFPNGPILSYVLQIVELQLNHSAFKDIAASPEPFYMIENLKPSTEYEILLSMTNPEGTGPNASAIVTTPVQMVQDVKETPRLILGTDHGVYSQALTIMDRPIKFYSNDHFNITGIAMHYAKRFLFIADDGGYITRASLEVGNSESTIIIDPKAGLNFQPLLLSVDWLNDHLYILGRRHNGTSTVWEICRCFLDGSGMTVATGGLFQQPIHVEVDPFNGYLYWVITGRSVDSGLYRLDLADISNGVKHKGKPVHIYLASNPGAFVIDHRLSKVFVPLQDNNTVVSVSFDGKQEDIRQNTQKAQFQTVNSMTMQYQNNVPLFYWTKGTKVIFEEYNKNLFFHNIFPSLNNNPVFCVSINVSASQPTPIPVNPPSNVQALLSAKKAKVSWRVPHLLGHQGKGAWQNWRYRLEVRDSHNNTAVHQNFSTTNQYMDLLLANANYTFRVAAYTEAGVGPWSREFTAKSLNSREERWFIWATEEGLFEGDMLGDHVKPLVTAQELDHQDITDLAWFEDMIYMVTRNQIKAYHRKTTALWTVTEIKSDFTAIKAIAIDWIGRRLYWSDPTQQTIARCRLDDGEQKETLNIVALAKELAVDSIRGFIYYATDHAVEAYRQPYAKNKTSYYQREQYSGSIVVGLTLDMDNERVYWIVRGSDGSTLYSAQMIKDWTTDITAEKIPLGEMQLRGPLVHFSDRLLWRKDDNSSAVADMMGKNVARIESPKFNGIRAIAVIDPTQHKMPDNRSVDEVNVIPDSVNETSIRTVGTWSEFNITWAPVTNVNYGTVFYELHIRLGQSEPIVRQVAEASFEFRNHSLHPFTPMEVKVLSYTYWGSIRRSGPFTLIHSPSGVPLAPVNLRVFVSHSHDHYKGQLNSTAFVRWNPPAKRNGILTHYLLSYCGPEGCQSAEIEPHVHQKVLENISHGGEYTIRIAAATEAGVGDFSEAVVIEPKVDNPLPRLLVGTMDQILKVDLDLNTSKPVVNRVNTPATHLVHISKEKRIFWTNENEIWSCVLPNETKTRLATLSTEPLSLTVDWVERILYWTTREGERSVIYQLNLNKFEEFKAGPEVLLVSEKWIKKVIVSPLDRLLIWLEFKTAQALEVGEIVTFDLNGGAEQTQKKFTNSSGLTCGTGFNHVLMLDNASPQERGLIWNEKDKLIGRGLKRREMKQLNYSFECSHSEHAKDSVRLYWINDNSIEASGDQSYSLQIPNAKTLISFYHQNYPDWNCLVPIQRPRSRSYVPTMEVQAVNNITLRLPQPEMHMQCPKRLPTIKYVIYYAPVVGGASDANCNETSCKMVTSLEETVTIVGLKPFTKYRFQVAIKSHYSEHTNINVALGPATILSTAPGAPSPPFNLKVEQRNPSAVKVTWSKPMEMNSDSIYYVVHYEFEDNSLLNHKQIKSATPEIVLQKLNANTMYKVWIRAHSAPETYSQSQDIHVTTLPQPEVLRAVNITSTNMTLIWRPHNIIKGFVIVYEKMGFPEEKRILYDSKKEDHKATKNTFFHGGLSPKTFYIYTVYIHYTSDEDVFTWPTDAAFKFETLGGVPTAPGQPTMKKGFNIEWEPSRENGAPIEEYSLEGYKTNSRRMGRRSTGVSPSSSTTAATLVFMNLVEELENITLDNSIVDEQWTVYYTGINNYWFAADLTDDLYRFRVRAKNAFGYSVYSATSEEISQGSVSSAELSSKTILYFVAIIVTTGLVVSICICITCKRPRNTKGHFIDTTMTDVELANLREMPRGANFSNNILYRIAPLTDSDIAQLPEISRDKIVMTNFLGSGAFGEVYEGCVKYSAEYDVRVAIKTLRKGATEQEKMEFLQEAQLMSNFKHEHILGLIGICFDHDNLYIIMELMQGGDLLSFLRQSRPTAGTPSSLTLLDLVSICVDVAAGCRYLEEMHFVHRDLACRNCLVSNVDPEDRVVKIGDFGLARDIYRNDYYRKEGEGLLPVRWMSPESLVDGVFTSQSDIWAFGVLCWEIMTLGQQPYPAMNNMEVLSFVRNGGRLGRPSGCPDELYQLMLECWKFLPGERPTFRYCLEVLEQLKTTTSSSIEITVATPNPRHSNGGIFNRSYLLADNNLNHPAMPCPINPSDIINNNNNNNCAHAINYNTTKPVPLKFFDIGPSPPASPQKVSSHLQDASHVELPPESPDASVMKPKYLELIYHPDDDVENICAPTTISAEQQQQQQHSPASSPIVVANSGYEIPITDLILKATAKLNESNFNRNMECVVVGDCKTVL